MPISMFDTRTMLDALRIVFAPKTFFLDTFFPITQTHDTAYVDIDVEKGKRKMAPFVNPLGKATPMDRNQVKTFTFSPPYIKPLRPITPQMLLVRQPGEMIYVNDMSPAERLAQMIGKDLGEMRDNIIRRIEWMAAQILLTGQVTVTGEGVNATIDFLRAAANTFALAGTSLWTDPASKPVDNIRDWKLQLAQESGRVPDVMAVGSDVAKAIYNNQQVKDLLHNRRVQMGQIDPTDLPDGSSYIGSLEDVDIYSYAEWFLDDNNVEQPMMPANKIILGSTKTRAVRHFGVIQVLEAMTGKVQSAAVDFFPRIYTENNPSTMFLELNSAPLPVTHEPDAFLCAQVI